MWSPTSASLVLALESFRERCGTLLRPLGVVVVQFIAFAKSERFHLLLLFSWWVQTASLCNAVLPRAIRHCLDFLHLLGVDKQFLTEAAWLGGLQMVPGGEDELLKVLQNGWALFCLRLVLLLANEEAACNTHMRTTSRRFFRWNVVKGAAIDAFSTTFCSKLERPIFACDVF